MAVVKFNKAHTVKNLLGLQVNEYPVKTNPKKRTQIRRGRPVNEVW